MAPDTPRHPAGNDAGFSAAELLVVLAALAALATVYMALQRAPEIYTVESAAQRLAAEIERARAEAVAREGEALIAVLPDGRFAARVGDAGSLSALGTPSEEWEALPEGIGWGAGEAGTDPLGRPAGPLPAQVYCGADGECSPPAPWAVYTLRSDREPHRVAAVTLDAAGSVEVWAWAAGTGSWTAVAR